MEKVSKIYNAFEVKMHNAMRFVVYVATYLLMLTREHQKWNVKKWRRQPGLVN